MSPSVATDVRPAAGRKTSRTGQTLTDTAINNAQPGDVLRDVELKGLHLRAFPGRKTFYLYFRTKEGVERRPKLGDYGVITLTQARAKARTMLAEIQLGGDPIAVREGAKGEHTVADLWDAYWRHHGQNKKTGEADKWRWHGKLELRIGRVKLSAVTFSTMSDLHKQITEKSGPVEANRVIALASKMFNFAHRPLEWFDGHNPCKGIARNKEKRRRRKAEADELPRLMARLKEELNGRDVASAAFVLFCLLTGARKGEIANTRPENIDGNRILLDEHKTDDGGYARIIYLPQAAQEIIENYLPRGGISLVLKKGERGPKTLTGILYPKRFWNRIRKDLNLVRNGKYLNIHDLRRTFASIAISTGKFSLEQVMQMLGQSSAQTTKTYAWLMDDAHADAVEVIADQTQLLSKPKRIGRDRD